MPEAWLSDTDPQAREVHPNLFRAMTPGRACGPRFRICEFQQSLQESSVRSIYPDADEREVFLRVAARRLGRDLMIAATAGDPDLHP